MTTELTNFLKTYVSTGEKSADGHALYTHTSMQPKCSYVVPDDKREELHRLIAQSILKKKPVYLTEKTLPVKPITIDIDLRYPMDVTQRQHNEGHIKALLKLYSEAIITYVDLPEDKALDAYVFERNFPYPSNGNIKDGLHIMYPQVCVSTDLQHVIRNHIIKGLDLFLNNPKIGKLPVKNTPEDIVDSAVVDRNPWTMFGCQKPTIRPYALRKVYRLNNSGDEMEFEEHTVPHATVDELTALITELSIHNVRKEYTYEIRSEHRELLEALHQKAAPKAKKFVSANYIKKQVKSINADDEQRRSAEEAEQLIELLADWRSDDTKHWIMTGKCLRNISPSLFDAWFKFSKRSDRYEVGDENRWYTFEEEPEGLHMEALHRWARLDNPEAYRVIRSEFLHPLIMSSVCGSSQDVAMVIHKMYRYQYVCLDAKGKRWAEFVNHTWKISQEGMSLKKKIGHEVLNEYLLLVSKYNHLAVLYSDDQKDQYLHKSKSLTDVTYKLRDITFKEKVMKECIILFHDPKFEEELDANPFLVGLENGVYDLAAGIFRNGCPEDKVSLSTGNDYPDFDPSDIDIENETSSIPQVEAIFDFLKQVFPIKPVRTYMYRYMASNLQGYNTDEKFHVWTGSGGNGKSKLLDLFEMAYGGYCFKMPINLLTQKRSQTGGATPELAMSRCKRFGSMQEPDEGARINTGLMKEYSGNDKVYYRQLYGEGGIMKPMFSMALLCNNKPKMTSDDDGTWRRMVVIEFISRFVEGIPKGRYEFTRNTNLSHLFPEWAPWYLAILTLWYKVYRTEGLNPPPEVLAATQDYRRQSDSYTMFMDNYFHKDSTGTVKLDESYAVFKAWFEAEYNDKAPPRRDFKSAVDRKLNQQYGSGSKAGWAGYNLVHPENLVIPAKSELGDEAEDEVADEQSARSVQSVQSVKSVDSKIKATIKIKPKAKSDTK